ncbi:hypothetical protein [Flavobacterium sp.]
MGCANDGLLSCIEKYLKQEKASNKELFMKRIDKLNSDEVFKGNIKKI